MSPSSPRPFQQDYLKYANTQDVFKKSKDMTLHKVLEGERKERMKLWITFFRRNPCYLIRDYFGIHLHPYQLLMIWVLQRSNLAYITAARAIGKTWLISVWSLTLAVLYPGIRIVVVAKSLKQGGILLSEKLTSLRDTYPNVAREIKSITTNANTYEAVFHCGSTIRVVPSSETARGNRANYIIVEEARLVPKEILEPIIKPFLFSRTPPWRLKPEYADDDDYREEGIISYITSAWYKAEYWYSYVRACIKRMAEGDETANFLAFDYLTATYHNIKTPEMIKNEMDDADPITVQMEYLNIPSGSSGASYFKLNMFPRTVKRSFYPQRAETYNAKKNPYEIKKVDGEIRIISIDVATRANKNNDQTSISCVRMIPMMGKGYKRSLVYMENHKGANTVSQAKRIKELHYDFENDYIVLDLLNAGVGVFDSLSQVTSHEERGIDFPPFTVVNDPFIDEKVREEMKERTLGINALPIIFPITASQQLNSQIAVAFRSSLQKKLWEFLIPEGEAEVFLTKNNKEFLDVDDSSTRAFFLSSYVNVGLFVGECINLDMSLVNGLIKLTEKPGNYRDRYTSVSYCNWIISNVFDKFLLKENEELDDWEILMGVTNIL